METTSALVVLERKLIVLTVPMRNGNLAYGEKAEEQAIVLTVPMRNGNKA